MSEKEELNIVMKASDILKKKDFTQSFKQVVDFVLKIQQKQAQAIQDLAQKHNALLEELKGKHNKSLEDLKIQTNQLFVKDRLDQIEGGNKSFLSKINKIIDQKLKDVDFRMSKVKDGERGLPGPQGPMGSPDSPEMIAVKLNGKELLNKNAIKDLEDELKRFRQSLATRGSVKNLGMRRVPIIRSIDLSSQCDGATRTFTGLPKDTVRIIMLQGSQFPFTMNSNDWTLAGTKFTLDNSIATPEKGQTLMALIETLFYA